MELDYCRKGGAGKLKFVGTTLDRDGSI